ncbi:uncharacterized protein LOC114575743 [Exaiptasia diaphana]|uniref:Uncharacterized protein n=1 Tax=Exaiptasia diaphana TaxID=2652724 RepID=A0A913YR90_EXADI|nr:uncharacterized protein LOC114575743 [Exaiptasia diaphana]
MSNKLVAYEHFMTEDTFNNMQAFREKMNQQPLYSALRSFLMAEKKFTTRQPGVYEIREGNQIIYIGGHDYPSSICDCLTAHFSGNDGLPIGAYLSGPARNKWKDFFVRWLPHVKPREGAMYLLHDYQVKHGNLPRFNLPPAHEFINQD